MTNKKGMTLVEVLVYIVLAGFLLAPVIMLMQNSSVTMARDAVNSGMKMSGREILNIIYDDLKNTGYKLKPDFTVDSAAFYLTDKAAFHTADSTCKAQALAANPPKPDGYCDSVIFDFDGSSFNYANKIGGGNNASSPNKPYFDSLRVKMGKLSSTGAWVGVDTIWYHVRGNDQRLTRDISGISGTRTDVLAKNVKSLKFRYSADLDEWVDAPDAVQEKASIQYIKAIVVLMDPKKLSPVNNQVITVIDDPDSTVSVTLPDTGKFLYERFEIVVPIPNNGLLP